MINHKVSPHFHEREFTDEPLTLTQRWLLERLCLDCLEPIRAIVGRPIYVTNGVRTWEKHEELERRGYDPCILTDHSFLLDWNPYGVGAADILKIEDTDRGTEIRSFSIGDYQAITEALDGGDGPPPWGQLIFYPERGHLHVSNPRELVFSDDLIAAVGFPPRRRTYIKES